MSRRFAVGEEELAEKQLAKEQESLNNVDGASQKPADSPKDQLQAGQYIVIDQALVSPNGRFRLVLQGDSNLVLYGEFDGKTKPIWHSNREYYKGTPRAATKALLRTDGNFELLSSIRYNSWESGSRGGNAVLSVQDNADVVIMSNGQRIWASNSAIKPPTDVLNPGETRVRNEPLVSANGKYRLTIQDDGNCVLSTSNRETLWASGTKGMERMIMTANGKFELRAWFQDKLDWWSVYYGKPQGATVLKLRDDGKLVILDGRGEVMWSPDRSLYPPDSAFYTRASYPCTRLDRGQYVEANQEVLSPNRKYAALFTSEGMVIVRHNNSNFVLWSSGTKNPSASRLVMQYDGNLVLEDPKGTPLWAADTRGDWNYLIVQDNGRAKIPQGWPRGFDNGNIYPAFSGKIDRLGIGEALLVDQGHSLDSKNGRYHLTLASRPLSQALDDRPMFTMGYQTMYEIYFRISEEENSRATNYLLWDTPFSAAARSLKILPPCALEVRDSNDKLLLNCPSDMLLPDRDSKTESLEFVMQDDGNAVLYRNGKAMWAAWGGLRYD